MEGSGEVAPWQLEKETMRHVPPLNDPVPCLRSYLASAQNGEFHLILDESRQADEWTGSKENLLADSRI
jgi:hypothetical protein